MQVLKKKKEDYIKNKDNITGTTMLQEIIKEEIKPVEKEILTNEKFSYGQSAGLKDDLDVDDNDIGIYLIFIL